MWSQESITENSVAIQLGLISSPTPPRRATSLALKTKRYVHHNQNHTAAADDDDNGGSEPEQPKKKEGSVSVSGGKAPGHGPQHNDMDDPTCTICFGPLEDGDRVGDLSCNHIFHAECLKSWLVRRNQCPLCAGDAAQERFNDEDVGQSPQEGPSA